MALGFAPLYNVLVGQQRTFVGFTSVYSFMYYLKAQNPGSSSAITALEAAENIGPHDAYHQPAAGYRRYTQVPSGGVPLTLDIDGNPLTTYNTYGSITVSSAGNKLYNRLLFYATAPGTGTFRIRATPLTGTDNLLIRLGAGAGYIDNAAAGTEYVDAAATSGEVLVFSVGSAATGTNPSGVTPFQLQFGTPVQVGKPVADPEPTLPRSNG